MKPSNFGLDYDEIIREPRMRALYGDSGYFNAGYWEEGVSSLEQACDRLVDELAASIPQCARLIVDVGCGVGGGTRRLAALFPEALLVAGNISHWQLQQGRALGVETPVVMDAARLPLASGSADAIVALESPQHFDTRQLFLAEARRVLRPGGILAMADMLFADREPIGAWMLPAANRVAGLAHYGELLEAAGFGEVRVRDATDLCWNSFCDAMRAVFPDHGELLDTWQTSVSHYVLVSARAA